MMIMGEKIKKIKPPQAMRALRSIHQHKEGNCPERRLLYRKITRANAPKMLIYIT